MGSEGQQDGDTTTLPLSSNSRLYLHSGFYDLLAYAQAQGSQFVQNFSPGTTRTKFQQQAPASTRDAAPFIRQSDFDVSGLPAQHPTFDASPSFPTPSEPAARRPMALPQANQAKTRDKKPAKRFSVDMIGKPTDFTYAAIASSILTEHRSRCC